MNKMYLFLGILKLPSQRKRKDPNKTKPKRNREERKVWNTLYLCLADLQITLRLYQKGREESKDTIEKNNDNNNNNENTKDIDPNNNQNNNNDDNNNSIQSNPNASEQKEDKVYQR